MALVVIIGKAPLHWKMKTNKKPKYNSLHNVCNFFFNQFFNEFKM